MRTTMWRSSPAFNRSWSLIVVLCIFWLVASGTLLSEPVRAIASVVCLGLVIQSWFAQRRCVRNRERFALATLALSLPAFASLWLGLNVLRFYSYSPESQASIYTAVISLQKVVGISAYVVGMVVILWTIGELASFLGKRISFKLVGRRKTWWNRDRAKGTWLWASPIGFAESALISSSLLRWFVVALSALGCLFALFFRLTRPDDEI